jgi:hypothetical protein
MNQNVNFATKIKVINSKKGGGVQLSEPASNPFSQPNLNKVSDLIARNHRYRY